MSMLRPLILGIASQNGQKVAVSFTLSSYINSKPTCRYKIISKTRDKYFTGQIRILILFIDLEFTF